MSDLDLSLPTDEVPRPEQRPLLRCQDLVVGYGGRPLLPPIDLQIESGEFWAVVGRNGSGKTTWFRTLLGLLPAVGGSVQRVDDSVRVTYIAQRVVFGLPSAPAPRPLYAPESPVLALVLFCGSAFAQQPSHPAVEAGDDWKLTFDGQVRPRLYWSTGKDFVDDGVEPGWSVAQRSRLG